MKPCFLFLALNLACGAGVTTIRVPNGGIQPQVAERDGTLHLVYFSGEPEKGDLFYVTSRDYGLTFSKPLQVNHVPGSAIAVGNIRGAQLALGMRGRVHVAWNGSGGGQSPMFYARMNDSGTAFEPERNLIREAYGIDGGGSLAADPAGNVYVFWHAPVPGLKGEQNRRVWVAKSADDGRTFGAERIAFDNPVGACGCCGLKAFADPAGNVYVLFRAADQVVNRDIWLLSSTDRGRTFRAATVSHWNIGACVMSSESLALAPKGVLAAWETEKQAQFALIEPGTARISAPVAAPGAPDNRKFPVVAANARGETLFAWTEGMAWKKAGVLSWQVYNDDGHPHGETGKTGGVPVWSVIAAFTRSDGNFGILY